MVTQSEAARWGKNITRFRGDTMTQEQLADRVGVTRNAVSMWESGNRVPTDEHKARIAYELGIDVPVIFPLFPKPAPQAPVDTERAA